MCATIECKSSLLLSLLLYATFASAVARCAGIGEQPCNADESDIASRPDPCDGATGVIEPFLQWTSGVSAVFHDVYLGMTPDLAEPDLVGSCQSGTMYYHVPGLMPGTPYYWRIDEIEADGTVHIGPVWTFTSAPETAWTPYPRDGDKWMETNTTLAWHAGLHASLHDVYLGTGRDAVADREGRVFQGSQAGCTFTPTTALVPETTYYWAVDEIDVNGLTHEGDIWSFTTRGPGGGVKAEYFDAPYPDGNPILTRLEDVIDHRWDEDVPAGAKSARWTADLGIAVADTYTFVATHGGGVGLSLDGLPIIDSWSGQTMIESLSQPLDLEPGFYGLEMMWWEGSAAVQLSWQTPSLPRQIIRAGALQPPVRARWPQPRRGSAGVPHNVTLTWLAGDGAAWHEVYFGEDRDAVAHATTGSVGVYRGRQTLDATTYTPAPLQWHKTYFWRVDETEVDGTIHQGSVWSFTTADFIVVDDFERYNDDVDAGEAIWQTWIDGWDVPGNGAIVGYIDWWHGWTIAHGGQQSMPYAYENSEVAYYSEATAKIADLEVTEDWTSHGVVVLSLYFRGNPANTPARMYVALANRDSPDARVYYSDPNATRANFWTEWTVPLVSFSSRGVVLTDVDRISIGFGDRDDPKPGGSGSMYFDDIRLRRPPPTPTDHAEARER